MSLALKSSVSLTYATNLRIQGAAGVSCLLLLVLPTTNTACFSTAENALLASLLRSTTWHVLGVCFSVLLMVSRCHLPSTEHDSLSML